MPIYMDRHDVSETVTAENVAQLHQQDLKIQHEFDCRGLTYWFDEKRKTAFCLIEAPNEKAIHEMHKQAHGEVPHRVIEVNPAIVESFLGRIEDPQKAQDMKLNIISDPAFRSIMVIELNKNTLTQHETINYSTFLQEYNQCLSGIISHFDGRTVNQKTDNALVSFKFVTQAVECAKNIQAKFTEINSDNKFNTEIKIGISAGVPVTKENILFEKAIKSAKRMCEISKADIIASAEVKDLYASENIHAVNSSEQIYFLTPSDESFLNTLMDFTESKWNNEHLRVDDFNTLGFIESQLYRKLTQLTGKSPVTFLKEYRLKKAIQLLKRKEANISEVSTIVGFSSPSYFSKCFKERYFVSPSDYIHTLEK